MGQHFTGNFFAQCWPTQVKTTLQIIFLFKVVHGLWVNITQVFSCEMLVHADQDNISFPVKTWLCALGQHCTSNCFVQCCPSMVDTTFYRLFSSQKLSVTMGQHCTGKTLVQCCSRGSRQHCIGKKHLQCCLNTFGITWQR